MLGLGEAGGRIAADLVAAGCAVRGWDPARRPEGIANADSDLDAVARRRRRPQPQRGDRRARARRPASPASSAADALYADLNTASPELKRELADALPVQFADVALVGVVPSSGLATPALASGAGAERFAELFRPLGMPVEVVGPQPGDAAGLKLLRSVFMKGIAAAAIESLEAAKAAGAEERVHAEHRRGARRAAARAAARRQPRPRRPARRRDARPPPPTSRSSASSRASPRPRPAWLEQLRDEGLADLDLDEAVGLERPEQLAVAERLAR